MRQINLVDIDRVDPLAAKSHKQLPPLRRHPGADVAIFDILTRHEGHNAGRVYRLRAASAPESRRVAGQIRAAAAAAAARRDAAAGFWARARRAARAAEGSAAWSAASAALLAAVRRAGRPLKNASSRPFVPPLLSSLPLVTHSPTLTSSLYPAPHAPYTRFLSLHATRPSPLGSFGGGVPPASLPTQSCWY